MPNRADYPEKREIDGSILYSFDGPFQLLHSDVGNLKFLGKNATFLNMSLSLLIWIHWKCMLIRWDHENKYYKK